MPQFSCRSGEAVDEHFHEHFIPVDEHNEDFVRIYKEE